MKEMSLSCIIYVYKTWCIMKDNIALLLRLE